MKKIPLLTLFTLFLGIGSFAQRNCQTVEYTNDIIENHPQALQEMMEIERHTAELQLHPRLRSGDQLIKIPVVVHILYNNAKENISDAIVHSQLEVLNEDYRMLNPDQTNEWAQAADINIEFYLASTDPQGNPTNGIIRRYTTYSDWNTGSQMKFTNYGGSDAWPSDQYLNIWVVDLKGGKMGFAQMPGGPAKTDGVVIDYAFFGRTNNNPKYGLGRTATHEIGHWLNLRHIWGDGGCHRDDFVSDTPSSDRPSTDCAEDKFTCGSKDMVANFMDYSYDYCMNLFTEGQKTRMRSLFAKGGFREDLLRSSGLDNHPQGDENSRVEDNHNAEEEETEQEEEDNKNNDQDQEEEENESTQQSDNESEDVKGNCSAPTNLSAHIEDRFLKANWESNAAAFFFEVKFNNSQWFGLEVSTNEISLAGMRANRNYEVRVSAICDDGSQSEPISMEIINGNRILASESYSIYGNPASDQLTISSLNSRKTRRIQLFDIYGRLALDQQIDSGPFQLDLYTGHLQAGTYILIRRNRRGRVIDTQKIVVVNTS